MTAPKSRQRPLPRGVGRRAARSQILASLHAWCDNNGIHWDDSYLLDRKSWTALRLSRYFRAQSLPSADWVLHVTEGKLCDLVNQTDPADQRYEELQAYLRSCGVGLHRLSPHFVRLYILFKKELPQKPAHPNENRSA